MDDRRKRLLQILHQPDSSDAKAEEVIARNVALRYRNEKKRWMKEVASLSTEFQQKQKFKALEWDFLIGEAQKVAWAKDFIQMLFEGKSKPQESTSKSRREESAMYVDDSDEDDDDERYDEDDDDDDDDDDEGAIRPAIGRGLYDGKKKRNPGECSPKHAWHQNIPRGALGPEIRTERQPNKTKKKKKSIPTDDATLRETQRRHHEERLERARLKVQQLELEAAGSRKKNKPY